MSNSSCEPSDIDFTANKRLSFLFWKLPIIIFIIGFLPYLILSEGIKLAAIAFDKDVKKLSSCAV